MTLRPLFHWSIALVAIAPATVLAALQAPTTRPSALVVGDTTLVFGGANDYSAFPTLVRTEHQLILRFNNQPLDELRASKVKHPHFGPAVHPVWAVSTDEGKSWNVTTRPATFDGKVVDAPNNLVLPSGDLLSLHWGYKKGSTEREPFVERTYRGTFDESTAAERRDPTFDNMLTHGVCALPPGFPGGEGFLTAAYVAAVPTGVNIVRSDASGEHWEKIAFVPSTPPFNFNESSICAFPDGRVLMVMRNDYDKKQNNNQPPPPDANGNGNTHDGYGYWLSQTESLDGGHTWSAPKQLPIWGHPPYLLKLKSGNLLMVYGHRRDPYSVRAILSHDEGRTWDMDSLVTLKTFEPARYDLGYPIATQLDDGRIVVAYYGYTTGETKIWDSPHGIFTTTLTELPVKP